MIGALERGWRPRLADLAHTLARKAEAIAPGGSTLAIVAPGRADLIEKLRAARAILEAPGDRGHDPRVVHYADGPQRATARSRSSSRAKDHST